MVWGAEQRAVLPLKTPFLRRIEGPTPLFRRARWLVRVVALPEILSPEKRDRNDSLQSQVITKVLLAEPARCLNCAF